MKNIFILIILVLMLSCKKYKHDYLYNNSWEVTSVYVNGVDSTEQFKQKYFRLINFERYEQAGFTKYNIIPFGYGKFDFPDENSLQVYRAILKGTGDYYFDGFIPRDSFSYPINNIKLWSLESEVKGFKLESEKNGIKYVVNFSSIDTSFSMPITIP